MIEMSDAVVSLHVQEMERRLLKIFKYHCISVIIFKIMFFLHLSGLKENSQRINSSI